MVSVEIGGKNVRLRPDQIVGKGGEADIYLLDPKTVLKLYKLPDDPDYANDHTAQVGAQLRLKEQQLKLPKFPTGLPPEVTAPVALALRRNEIAGYTMPYLSGMDTLMNFSNRAYRDSNSIDTNAVIEVFRTLHQVVERIHSSGVVIGDFNDLNVLVRNSQVRLVDSDSMQFGAFQCRTFTTRFMDPLLTSGDHLSLARPHNANSDWYAYFVMLIQSMLYVGPYGGVHRPKVGKRLQHDDRVLQRVTILSPDVVYPKPAEAFGNLPDDWQAQFAAMTTRDERGVFPMTLLESIRFTACRHCGRIHARAVCPQCSSPGVVRQKVSIRGTVTATRLFYTSGRILQAVVQDGVVRYLYEEAGSLYRENARRLMASGSETKVRFRIQGEQTLIGKGNMLVTVAPDGTVTRANVEQYREKLPMFDTNARSSFWLQGGQLVQSALRGPGYVGPTLTGQTMFWVGNRLGFGLYQAGQLVRGFTFAPGTKGLNDQVDIGVIRGQLVDATCTLSDDRAWLFTTTNEGGQLLHRLKVFTGHGSSVAEASAIAGEDSWLGAGIRGHLAVGTSLFVATDDGLVRINAEQGSVSVEREFPDTEPFVTAVSTLLVGADGIIVVSKSDITLLKIK